MVRFKKILALLAHPEIKLALILFFLVFVGYCSNILFDYNRDLTTQGTRRLLTSDDLIPNTFLPYLILKKQTMDFSSIYELMQRLGSTKGKPYFLFQNESGYYSVYPVISAFFALPFYVFPMALNKIPNLDQHLYVLKILFIGRITASFYAALSVGLFYFLLESLKKGTRAQRIIFTIFYALGTTTWSISSRGVWMHTFSQFLITLSLILLFLRPNKTAYLGFILSLAVLVRPTNAIFLSFIALYILIYRRDKFPKFVIAGIPAVIFMVCYNNAIFGSPFVEGYGARNDTNWSTPLTQSLAGFAFSPARSFLFVSPPLLLGLVGMVRCFLKKDRLRIFLSLAFAAFVLVIGKWWAWHGANGFGYRMLTEMVPIIAFFAYEEFSRLRSGLKVLVILLMVYSIYVHANAVIFRKSRCDYEHNWSFYCLSPPRRMPKY